MKQRFFKQTAVMFLSLSLFVFPFFVSAALIDDFEVEQGWVVNPYGTDNAISGMWQRSNPQQTSYSGIVYQNGTTNSGYYALVTGPYAGSSAGSYDIDGGVTSVRSYSLDLPSGGNISFGFAYYFAHYTNATQDDFLRVSIISDTVTPIFEVRGAPVIRSASWNSYTTNLNDFAGSTVQILIEAADYGTPSLVEAAIDDIVLTFEPSQIDIQDAIAQASDGDIIVVPDGIYDGGIDFLGKAITLVSQNGPENCIINGANTVTGVKFINNEGPRTVLSGFTITHCVSEYGQGGGIHCGDSTSPTILNCVIKENKALFYQQPNSNWGGGGIYCGQYSAPFISNCTIKNNSTESSVSSYESAGGGIYCARFSHPRISGCVIDSNQAISTAASSAYAFGGAIAGYYAFPEVNNSFIRHNSVSVPGNSIDGFSMGGGAYFAFTADQLPVFRNCEFVANTAQQAGGALAQRWSGNENNALQLVNCSFDNNSVTYGQGGSLYFYNAKAIIRASILDNGNPQEILIQDDLGTTLVDIDYCGIDGGSDSIVVNTADPGYNPLQYGVNNYTIP